MKERPAKPRQAPRSEHAGRAGSVLLDAARVLKSARRNLTPPLTVPAEGKQRPTPRISPRRARADNPKDNPSMLPAVKQLLAFQMAAQPALSTGPFAKDKTSYGE